MDSLTDFPANIDREQAFLVFATMCGDIVRSAAALGVPEAAVLKMAEEEGWHSKLGPILALKRSSRPGSVERACNRALNFVQAHRMRLIVQRAIQRMTGMNEVEFDSYLLSETTSKGGEVTRKLTTRALADLSAAMDKCHAMTYAALNDTTQGRANRKEDSSEDEVSS